MSKKSNTVSKYFIEKNKNSKTTWQCKFCDLVYTVKNMTKMKIQACKKTPLKIKEDLNEIQKGNFLKYFSFKIYYKKPLILTDRPSTIYIHENIICPWKYAIGIRKWFNCQWKLDGKVISFAVKTYLN